MALGHSQTYADSSLFNKKSPIKGNEKVNINIVKFNLAGLVLNNYTFQYERVFKRKMSVALSARFMPYSTLPIKQLVRDYMGNNNPDSYGIIDRFKVSNFSFTPEVRFYLGKGNGQGFYIAPFYRFSQFKSDDLFVGYTVKENPTDLNETYHEVNFKGKLTGHTLGVIIGSQWSIKNRFIIDWSIAGPHWGISNGNFVGITNYTLDQNDKDKIINAINDLDIPLTKLNYEFPAPNVAKMKFNGPWGGVRVGLSVGYKF